MEEYRQRLYKIFGSSCRSIEDIYNCIKNDNRFTYTTNDSGLHSYYTGSCYYPAIIRKTSNWTIMYWLFDGEIKDCTHPFSVRLYNEQLYSITYYSSERIMTDQPIYIEYNLHKCILTTYNQYTIYTYPITILEDTTYRQGTNINPLNDYNESLFTPEFYPLWDEMDVFKLKFAD